MTDLKVKKSDSNKSDASFDDENGSESESNADLRKM